jgi:DNA-binding transcriptional LysR family regulator
MNIRRPDLSLLAVLDAIASTGSVSAAAKRLALSQPAVSHALARLRRLMDDPLFVRNGRGMTLTPRAAAMRGRVRDILSEADQLLYRQQFNAHSAVRDFTVVTSDYAAVTIIPVLLGMLRKAAPGVNVVCKPFGESTLDDLAEGRADLSFWAGKPPKNPFHTKLLYREHLVGVMSSKHPLATGSKKRRVTTKLYVAYPHAVVSLKDPGPNAIEIELARLGLKRRTALVSQSFLGNINSLHGSDLLTAVPARLIDSCNISGVTPFELPFKILPYDYGLVWHERVVADPGVQWLRELTAAAAARHK